MKEYCFIKGFDEAEPFDSICGKLLAQGMSSALEIPRSNSTYTFQCDLQRFRRNFHFEDGPI